MSIIQIFLILLLIVSLFWIAGFLIITDFPVPSRKAWSFQHILAIFPHADDEAVSCGGFLHHVARNGCTVTLALLTRGERGTPEGEASPDLKNTRANEATAVSTILGISRLIQGNFRDGALHDKRHELTTFIDTLIQEEKPDLLISYDLSGFYGHLDHITCAEVITELQKNRFREVPLWYVTFPKRVLTRTRQPEHIATDPHIQQKRALPTHKIFIGVSVFPKIRAWYTYKSQRASLTKGIGQILPIWFFLSMMLFEYFTEVN